MKLQDRLLEGRMLVILTGLYIAFNFTSLAFLFYVIGNFSELKLILYALHTGTLLFLFLPVMFGFNRLLVRHADYREITFHIHFFVWSNLFFWLIGGVLAAGYFMGLISGWVSIISGMALISLFYLIPPILLIVIGVRLKNCPDDLYGLLKPIRLTFFWTGIIYLSFVLSELALVISWFNDILLFMLFYRLYWSNNLAEQDERMPFTISKVLAAFFISILLYVGSYASIAFIPMGKALLSSDEEAENAIVQEEIERIQHKGLEPQESLREKYTLSCRKHAGTSKQGDLSEICEDAVNELLAETLHSNLSAYDAVELAVAVCQRQSDDDKEYSESCASDADWHEWEIFSDAIGLALCGFDRAWIINPEHGVSITKRGRDVYRDQKLMVSCDSHELEEVNYYGFFSDSVVIRQEDEEYENEYEYESPFDEAFDQGTEALAQFIDNHTFGIDEEYDKQIIDGLAYRSEYSELLATAIQKDNARVNFSIDYYSQPLMHAIENANDKGAKVLLNAGASPSIPGEHGILPLSKAVRYCSLEVIQLLVENGADINGVTGSETLDYAIPLKNAAFAGNAQAVSFLLDIGAKLLPDNPENYPHFDAQELLYYASVSGDLKIFNSFVKSGATIPMGEEASAKIIEAIVGGKNPAMLRQAFSMGLQLPKTQYHSGIYEQIVKITTDRHDPHVDEGMTIFDLLIANGLDMSRQMDTGWHYGHQAIQYYTRFDALVSDDEDEARIAAKQTLFVLRVIEEVLKTGVDINATYEKQQTMLMEAAGRAQYEIVNYLLARNADPNLKDANGNTALEIAMEERRRKTKLWKNKVKLKDSFNQTILSLGGDPNVQVDTATAPVVTDRQSKGQY